MDYERVLLNGVTANGTGPIVDLGEGEVTDTVAVQAIIVGTVTAFSIQLQGSEDGSTFANVGTAITTTGITRPTIPPCRYFQAVLTGYTGTGTVTALLEFVPLT
jgi:hypothetical protein